MAPVTLCIAVEPDDLLAHRHLPDHPLAGCLLPKHQVDHVLALVIQQPEPVDLAVIVHEGTYLVNSLRDVDLCRRLLFVEDLLSAEHRAPDTVREDKLQAAERSSTLLVVDLRELDPLVLRKFPQLPHRRPLAVAVELLIAKCLELGQFLHLRLLLQCGQVLQ